MNEYTPCPADTSGIELPSDLMQLAEDLARNVHEVWADGRRSQGWTYGPRRDDVRLRHPGLVPYEMLSEEEKDYDRRTALSTLRFIMSRGFRITR